MMGGGGWMLGIDRDGSEREIIISGEGFLCEMYRGLGWYVFLRW